MRVELPNGDWIDLVDRLNYGQQRRIADVAGSRQDRAAETIAAMVLGWSLRDDFGDPIELPPVGIRGIPTEALDPIPLAHAVIIADAVSATLDHIDEPVPKATGETSSVSSPAPRSVSRRSLPTRSSSPATDGAGTSSRPPLPM